MHTHTHTYDSRAVRKTHTHTHTFTHNLSLSLSIYLSLSLTHTHARNTQYTTHNTHVFFPLSLSHTDAARSVRQLIQAPATRKTIKPISRECRETCRLEGEQVEILTNQLTTKLTLSNDDSADF